MSLDVPGLSTLLMFPTIRSENSHSLPGGIDIIDCITRISLDGQEDIPSNASLASVILITPLACIVKEIMIASSDAE